MSRNRHGTVQDIQQLCCNLRKQGRMEDVL
jgi:hypothetical protein